MDWKLLFRKVTNDMGRAAVNYGCKENQNGDWKLFDSDRSHHADVGGRSEMVPSRGEWIPCDRVPFSAFSQPPLLWLLALCACLAVAGCLVSSRAAGPAPPRLISRIRSLLPEINVCSASAKLLIQVGILHLLHGELVLCPLPTVKAVSGHQVPSELANFRLEFYRVESWHIAARVTADAHYMGSLWYSIYPYSVLERCGIKHPKPTPFFGNLMLFRNGFLGPHADLINKYGRVCGYYLGRRPVVIVADPDMLRQVMVKEFSRFPNRMTIRGGTKPMSESLIMLKDERWRRVRSILTPSFSAAKMKEKYRDVRKKENDLHYGPLAQIGVDRMLIQEHILLGKNQKILQKHAKVSFDLATSLMYIMFAYTLAYAMAKMVNTSIRNLRVCHANIFVGMLLIFQMVPLINTATETLLNNLKTNAESGDSFDIHRCFGCFTMDVIASVAFGTQVDSQKNPDDPFVHHASKFFSFTFFRPFMIFLIAFPFLLNPLAGLIPNKSRDEMNRFFISCIQKIIKQRDELPPEQRRRDFLQLMLDVRSSSEFLSVEHFDVVNHADEQACSDQETASGQENSQSSGHDSAKRAQQKRMMTEDEIVGQAFIFLLAGYETSSNTLAFTCYLLAIHQECQDRVQQEVDEFFSRHLSNVRLSSHTLHEGTESVFVLKCTGVEPLRAFT
ncbi:Thromboxane-A synthase [Triplophysa tibetana]|uniref:Cytochrome P450 3A n=1 Tax=Triplophysa tibetana TaxID=1572043 RepID=A0A5A9NY33_9TELE|nr:Thromboxane-A synthase [Triplophysa tibetana]